MVRCGKCGQQHESAKEVRACYGLPPEPQRPPTRPPKPKQPRPPKRRPRSDRQGPAVRKGPSSVRWGAYDDPPPEWQEPSPITCWQCGELISDRLLRCPGCGEPIV
jgi:hypothetical protein